MALRDSQDVLIFEDQFTNGHLRVSQDVLIFEMSILPMSSLVVSPLNLNFTAVQNSSNPSLQNLNISNGGSGTLNWTVTSDSDWLSVSPASGTGNGTVAASIDISRLAVGVYNGNLTVSASGASGSPVTVPTVLTITAPLNCSTPISSLASNVLARIEENYSSGIDSPGPVFWNQQFEIYTAIVEAMNDLMLLVGRPTQTVQVPFSLTPNSVWQTVPQGVFLISDIWGQQSRLRKFTLFSYDYEQPGNIGSDWENDVSAAGPRSWAPVGMTMFIVHPAPSSPQTVLLDGIAYPVAETNFPYTGAETVPFHNEFYVFLEEYAAHILRIKEGTAEFQESLSLYKNYLEGAKRLTTIEDRRDPVIFSSSFGAPAGVNSHTKR